MKSRPPPLKLKNNERETPSDVSAETCRPEVHDQVFITDNENVYRWALKDTFLFRFLKVFTRLYLFKAAFDGVGDINPVWQAVLSVDDIVKKKQHVYVGDTLVLYCDSTNSYEKIIPFIFGLYTRLVLHGNVNADQVKRLVSKNVHNVRISANLNLPEKDYDDFAKFIADQTCGFNPCFTIDRNENITSEFCQKLDDVCYLRKRDTNGLPPRYEIDREKFVLQRTILHHFFIHFTFLATF